MNTIARRGPKHRGYRAYKSSDVAWLGEVPEHWDVLRLKYSAELVNEKVDGIACELPYTGLEHVESWTGKRLANDGEASSDGQASVHRAGDVLFGKLRPYLAKAYAAESGGVCTSEFLVLRPRALLQRFLRDYLLNQSFISIVDSSTYGAKMPRASWDFIGSLPALVPPLDEQRAIAAFLDRETARIDALIEKKRRQIELLHEKRAALISHAVTKGLDPSAPMKDSGIAWLGQVPEEWRILQLRRALSWIEQGWSPQCENRQADEGEWAVLKAGCANYGRFHEEEHKALPADVEPSSQYEIRPGDLLMSRACGTPTLVGSVAIVESCRPRLLLCDKVFRLHPETPAIDVRFLYLALNSRAVRFQIEQSISGAEGLANNITQESIKGFVLAIPPREEQQRIAASVATATSKIDALVGKVTLSIDRLREYRTALISAAVTGKLDVRQEVA
jgi:type I restriction enzyme S subunit